VIVVEPPIGFVPLREAADEVGRKVCGSRWRSLSEIDGDFAHITTYREEIIAGKLDPEIDRIIRMIAEQCAAGEIAATYRSVTGGADNLDRSVWQLPCWRNYFATGMIDLKLPLLEEGRPSADGRTAPRRREIFVGRQDLDQFVDTLDRPNTNSSSTARASSRQIAEIVRAYRRSLAAGATPSKPRLERFAREKGLSGHRDELRDEYDKQFPHQRVGRPSK
jgi:hypothetical protein